LKAKLKRYRLRFQLRPKNLYRWSLPNKGWKFHNLGETTVKAHSPFDFLERGTANIRPVDLSVLADV